MHTGQPLKFQGVPRFPAEHFGRVRLKDTRYKQFDEGLKQLEEEGLMQVFYTASGRREPIVGVVGQLQLDVITSRLRSEYNVDVVIESATYTAARWLADPLAKFTLGGQGTVAADRLERKIILFSSQWELDYFIRQHPAVELLAEISAGMISFSKISKQYGRQILFVDASFQLNEGEKVGLVGPNGSGKTTLFRMITGEESPDDGEVSVPRKVTIGYFRQDVEEMSGRSVLDEAIAGSGRLGALHHELEDLQQRWRIRRRPATWTRRWNASASCRKSTRARRLRPREPHPRNPARARV